MQSRYVGTPRDQLIGQAGLFACAGEGAAAVVPPKGLGIGPGIIAPVGQEQVQVPAVELPVFHGTGVMPGVDLSDTASLLDLMDKVDGSA